ncbi:MAG: acyl-CoA dehydratase activase-related protein [Firmicutes bacterium]|nr:acyl-CoA dehydratase activase-related protein [Bacillota bacterium]
MKVSFPHLGNISIPLKAFFSGIGMDVVTPPPTTRKTVAIGAQLAPETACLPLKVTTGNMVEAINAGADTVFMVGGIGPCRLGYYCELQKHILADLGHDANLIAIEPPKGNLRQTARFAQMLTSRARIRDVVEAGKLAWEKCIGIDILDQLANAARWSERKAGAVDRAVQAGLDRLDMASRVSDVREAIANTIEQIRSCSTLGTIYELDPCAPSLQVTAEPLCGSNSPVSVGVVGEIYVVMEPAVNMNLCKKLGAIGAVVSQPITFSGWIMAHVVLDIIKLMPKPELLTWAVPYLRNFVGGHGVESVGRSVQMARRGLDGVVHVSPLTCMPEIVAQSILPRVSEKEGIPIMSLAVDEHTADAGLDTRLEAFCDLLAVRSGKRLHGVPLTPCQGSGTT